MSDNQIVQSHFGYIVRAFGAIVSAAFVLGDFCQLNIFDALAYGYDE